MERKYMMVFLMGLLCLVGDTDLFSQQCYKISYDKNGNRNSFATTSCLQIWRENPGNIEFKDNNNSMVYNELLVYPNPNNGVFSIEVENDDENAELQIYNSIGVLINRCGFDKEIDISDYPAGLYLLRMISGNDEKSVIVIKK